LHNRTNLCCGNRGKNELLVKQRLVVVTVWTGSGDRHWDHYVDKIEGYREEREHERCNIKQRERRGVTIIYDVLNLSSQRWWREICFESQKLIILAYEDSPPHTVLHHKKLKIKSLLILIARNTNNTIKGLPSYPFCLYSIVSELLFYDSIMRILSLFHFNYTLLRWNHNRHFGGLSLFCRIPLVMLFIIYNDW